MAIKKDKLIDLEQLQIVSKNKQKQIDNLKEKKVNKEEGKSLSSNDFTDSYKAQVEANTTAIEDIKDGTNIDSFSDVELALKNKLNSVELVTYAELISLKNSSHLLPNQYYRITDYVTTTSQTGTQSAGHQFDIIVMALTNNKLSEDAYADKHDGDTYFVNNDLTKWKLKYCLDNDATRFDWADTTNGKGVIFRLIDENLNDLPYDFKNIQFARYKITTIDDANYSDFVGKYFGFNGALGTTIDGTDFKYYYTFNIVENNEIVDNYDLSIQNTLTPNTSSERFVKQVTIKEYLNDSPNYRGIKSLNNFVIASGNIVVDIRFDYGSHHNTIIITNDYTYNYYGSMFRNNLIWVGNKSHNNARECFENNLVLCPDSSKTFNWNYFSNHFGYNYCKQIRDSSLGEGCIYNKFSDSFEYCNIGNIQHLTCIDVNMLSSLTFCRLIRVTIKNRGIERSSGNILQFITLESQEINTTTLKNIDFNVVIQTNSNPARILYDTSSFTLPNMQHKVFDKIQYTNTGGQKITVYTITWQEYEGTEFKTKKYYSTDLGLTWTEDSGYLMSASEKTQITTNKNDITSLQNGKQNALTTDNTINLVSDVISVNTNVIATKSYAESLFATSEEIDTMLEEVFG